jgi:hypothetical protein
MVSNEETNIYAGQFQMTAVDCGKKATSRRQQTRFTKEADKKLALLVRALGENSWQAIAEQMGSHTGRQCRARWRCYLQTSTDGVPWTPGEDFLLSKLIAVHGLRFGAIRVHFAFSMRPPPNLGGLTSLLSALCHSCPELRHLLFHI